MQRNRVVTRPIALFDRQKPPLAPRRIFKWRYQLFVADLVVLNKMSSVFRYFATLVMLVQHKWCPITYMDNAVVTFEVELF